MLSRRQVLQRLALLTAASTLAPWRTRGGEPADAPRRHKLGPRLPERALGLTGLHVSMLTVGGHHVGRPSEAEAERIIAAGVRTFETAELYQEGESETRYGKFLTPKYREHLLILTKTMAADAKTAQAISKVRCDG